MQVNQKGTSELAIFSRVLNPDQANLSVEAARSILDLGFPPADKDRMRHLSAKAREGMLTLAEQGEINRYELVGHILSLMKSKARRSLRLHGATNGNSRTQ